MALKFPEGHKGLVCTIQYALPAVDHKTYYAQAVHIAEKIVEWQNNPTKIPGTVLVKEGHNANPTCHGFENNMCVSCFHKDVCKYAPSEVCDKSILDYASEQAKDKFMFDLAKFIDNADNSFDTHTHGSAILIADLVNWMMSKGYIP